MSEESGFSFDHHSHFAEIRTREQGAAYVGELLGHLEMAREVMDQAQLVQTKQKAFHNLLIRYGRALGALTTLMHCRILENADYDRFAPRVHGAIVPKVVATVQG